MIVRQDLMSDAMISRSCANFLQDVDVGPRRIYSGGALNKHKTSVFVSPISLMHGHQLTFD